MLSTLRFATTIGVIPAAIATYSVLMGRDPWYAPLIAFGVTVWVAVFLALLIGSTKSFRDDFD